MFPLKDNFDNLQDKAAEEEEEEEQIRERAKDYLASAGTGTWVDADLKTKKKCGQTSYEQKPTVQNHTI